jgi:hypothetical protein
LGWKIWKFRAKLKRHCKIRSDEEEEQSMIPWLQQEMSPTPMELASLVNRVHLILETLMMMNSEFLFSIGMWSDESSS